MPIRFEPEIKASGAKVRFETEIPAPEEPLLDKIGSGVKAFFTPGGQSIGESIPIIGPLASKAAQGARAVIEGGISDDETIPQAFDRIGRESEAEKKAFAEKNPGAALARGLVGGVGGLAIPVPGAGLPGILGAATRTAGQAGLAYADQALQGGDGKRAATVAAGIQAGIEAIPYIGKFGGAVANTIRNAGDKVEDVAQSRAVKSALSNNAKAWKDLGEGRVLPTGKVALDEGIVRFGEKASQTAERAKGVAKETWAKVDDIFSRADAAGVAADGKEIAEKILQKAADISDVPQNAARIEQLQNQAAYYEKLGKISLRDLQALKNEYDWKKVDKLKDVLGKNGNNLIDRIIGDSIKDTVAKSGLEGAENFKDLYKTFGAAKTLEKGAEETSRRLTKNRSPFSLTDYLAGGAAGAAGAAITGDPKESAKYGAVAAFANHIARTRGNSALAVGLNVAAKLLKNSPDFAAKYGQMLNKAATSGSAALTATHLILMNQDPDYSNSVLTSGPDNLKSEKTAQGLTLPQARGLSLPR